MFSIHQTTTTKRIAPTELLSVLSKVHECVESRFMELLENHGLQAYANRITAADTPQDIRSRIGAISEQAETDGRNAFARQILHEYGFGTCRFIQDIMQLMDTTNHSACSKVFARGKKRELIIHKPTYTSTGDISQAEHIGFINKQNDIFIVETAQQTGISEAKLREWLNDPSAGSIHIVEEGYTDYYGVLIAKAPDLLATQYTQAFSNIRAKVEQYYNTTERELAIAELQTLQKSQAELEHELQQDEAQLLHDAQLTASNDGNDLPCYLITMFCDDPKSCDVSPNQFDEIIKTMQQSGTTMTRINQATTHTPRLDG